MALHRRHALPDRQPGRPRGVLPERHATARRRACGETTRARSSSIAGKHEGPEAAALLERWWNEAPETFSVVRDRDGTVAGFLSVFEGHQLKRSIVGGDPILEAWARDLAVNPLPKGQVALGLRRWLDAERRRRPLRDTGRLLARRQAHLHGAAPGAPAHVRRRSRRADVLARGREARLPALPDSEAVLDGSEYASVVLDFGPGSVDGWLASLVADELGIEEDPELDEGARELSVDGKPVPLTRSSTGSSGSCASGRGRRSRATSSCARSGDGVHRREQRRRRRSPLAAAQARRRGARRRDRARQRLPPAPRLAPAPELEPSPKLHQAFIERVAGRRTSST